MRIGERSYHSVFGHLHTRTMCCSPGQRVFFIHLSQRVRTRLFERKELIRKQADTRTRPHNWMRLIYHAFNTSLFGVGCGTQGAHYLHQIYLSKIAGCKLSSRFKCLNLLRSTQPRLSCRVSYANVLGKNLKT